jgi:hypothetical protein
MAWWRNGAIGEPIEASLRSQGQDGDVVIEKMHRGVGSKVVGTSSDKEIPVIEARSKRKQEMSSWRRMICCVCEFTKRWDDGSRGRNKGDRRGRGRGAARRGVADHQINVGKRFRYIPRGVCRACITAGVSLL